MVPEVVRQRIRHRIEDGSLPCDRTIELWHGVGFGQTCDGCGDPITTTDKMSLLCADDWRVIRLHVDCFEVWDAARVAQPDEQ